MQRRKLLWGADGDTLTVSATSASGASVTLNAGNISYDPTAVAAFIALGEGETATDSFTYTVSDGNGGTDAATVTMTTVWLVETAQIPSPALVATICFRVATATIFWPAASAGTP